MTEPVGRPKVEVLVHAYVVEDKSGCHRLVTTNASTIQQFGGQAEFHKILAAQYRSFKLLLTASMISFDEERRSWTSGDSEKRQRKHSRLLAKIRRKYPEIEGPEPWLSETSSLAFEGPKQS